MDTDDNRTPAVLSLTIRGIERDLERTPGGRGGIISFKPATPGIGGSGTPGDNLLADWRELEAALAAERDRADRAVTCVEQISAAVYGRKIPYTAEGGHAVINDVLSALSRFREATA